VPGPSTPDAAASRPALPTPPPRPADQLSSWAARVSPVIGVPAVAVQAYGYTQLTMKQHAPGCRLSWTTLAGIGQVESSHGQADGAVLQATGRSAPLVVGSPLDGKAGRALVQDTDAGAFDGDVSFDRTMGPMRLLPSEWRLYQIDADGDGIMDPFDLDDSVLAMGRLLCAGNQDLSGSGWNAAIGRHNSTESYARSVFNTADSYGQRTRDLG
jgi:membrane-bound lytic murein transglycosylase B